MKTLLPSPPLHENKIDDGIDNLTPRFSFRSRMNSLAFAGRGILLFFKNEHNARLHLAATILVLLMAVLLGISRPEAIALCFCISMVWITEIINTAIEKTMDFISTERHPQIALIKDLAAGAVLVASVFSLIVGLIIFIPKIQLHEILRF